jgi:hypothetical protein
MGSEVLGSGADVPGPTHVAAPAAHAWAIAAANAAVRVPAANAEAAAWTVRGWADVAVGCLALDGSASSGSGEPGADPAVAEVPSTASPLAQQIWRGIHEGAHLDHLSALTALGPAAPSPAEFGTGLLIAESYAMAVEILAAVECIMADEGHAVWQLGNGLIERATRLPGGSNPAPEFTDLPTLAEVYVLGPLEVLTGGDAARALPEQIVGSLRARWRFASAAYPPAAAFVSGAAELLVRSPRPLRS